MNVKITGPNGSTIFEADQVDYDKRRRTLRMATAGVFGPDHLLEAGVNAYVTNSAGETIAKYEGRADAEPDRGVIEFCDGSSGTATSGFTITALCGLSLGAHRISGRRDDGASEYAVQVGASWACLDRDGLIHLAARLMDMADIGIRP